MKHNLFIFGVIALLLCAAFAQAVDKSACALEADIGPCRKADSKFYFDSKKKVCQHFFYGGCQGNANRFDTKEDCEKLCLPKA